MAAAGLVFSIGALVGVYSVAQTTISVVMVFAMVRDKFIFCAFFIVYMCPFIMQVFGGFFVSLDAIPGWLSWLQWFSLFKYTFAVSEN